MLMKSWDEDKVEETGCDRESMQSPKPLIVQRWVSTSALSHAPIPHNPLNIKLLIGAPLDLCCLSQDANCVFDHLCFCPSSLKIKCWIASKKEKKNFFKLLCGPQITIDAVKLVTQKQSFVFNKDLRKKKKERRRRRQKTENPQVMSLKQCCKLCYKASSLWTSGII